jgi:hypothetical protein
MSHDNKALVRRYVEEFQSAAEKKRPVRWLPPTSSTTTTAQPGRRPTLPVAMATRS